MSRPTISMGECRLVAVVVVLVWATSEVIGQSNFGEPLGFPSPFTLTTSGLGDSSTSTSASASASSPALSLSLSSSPLAWQPLGPRASFRPFNRRPSVPEAPSAPAPPSPPESLALAGELNGPLAGRPFSSLARDSFVSATSDASTTTTRPPSLASNFAAAAAAADDDNDEDDDDLPTRQPLSRFRPTRAPSDDLLEDPQAGSASDPLVRAPTSTSSSILNPTPTGGSTSGGPQAAPNATSGLGYKITNECYECICEASTGCNANSRCQTSDVRNTRCGMFLISYDQWLAAGLSRELVTRDALERDPAADERAFYECVTQRDCSHRLLAIYLQRMAKDCDKDGRIDCYDLAAIHHSGVDQCAGEALLDSQYWGDFNACFGFGRR